MNPTKQAFAERLIAAMQALGLEPKPAVLEREFNQRYWGKAMTLHGVRRWLRGETLPSHEKLLVLAEWLRVQPQELRDGPEVEARIRKAKARWDEGVGYTEREVFEAFLSLPAPQKKIVCEVILAFAKAQQLQ
ncbi:hypothetical protein GCM10027046_23450 [Uliginosibacterium flavum]|uniref:DNA-binding protein n=1 Tax=Uliginosibacterium flavum TaxID=1396831 RepID=A0ABV2TQT6_9RHOO